MKKKERTNKKKQQLLLNYSELAQQARSGQFGNLRLLALSVGVMLLCAVGLLYARGKSTAPTGSLTANAESSDSSAQAASTHHAVQNEAGSEMLGAGAMETGLLEDGGKGQMPSGQLGPEDLKQRSRDMAERMPEGQVIIF